MLMRAGHVALAVMLVCLPGQAGIYDLGAQAGASVFVLRSAPDGVRIDAVPIADGQTLTFTIGRDSDVIDLVLPFAPGQSGSIAQRGTRTVTASVTRTGDMLVQRVMGEDGSSREYPAVSLSALLGYVTRVNVIGGGTRTLFIIEDGVARRGSGPVIDLFGGRIPLGPDDFSITTQVTVRAEPVELEGTVELVMLDDPLKGLLVARGRIDNGPEGEFIVDLGATGTVVDRAALPPGVEVRPLSAVEITERGKRTLNGSMAGAGGGAVAGFQGTATIPALRLGEVVLRDAETNVLDEMPELGGRKFLGIIGQNLLRRAGRLVFTVPAAPHASGTLRFGGPALGGDEIIVLPFTEAQRHIFVEGAVSGRPLTFLVDTGARRSTIPQRLADELDLPLFDDGGSVRGLDERAFAARSCTVPVLALGDLQIDNVHMLATDMPVLGMMGLGDRAGLLGMDVLGRFATVEVDYGAKTLRLVRR